MFAHSRGVVISGGIFTNVEVKIQVTAFEHLQKAATPSAFHNSKERFDPPKCHPNTRIAVLERIMAWILRQDDWHAYIMWLYGGAALENPPSHNPLLSGLTPKSISSQLIATIAYQICLTIPGARDMIEFAIDHDPLIFTRSLQTQLKALIVEPLNRLQALTGYFSDPAHARLVIIDGLDECQDANVQCNILDIISNAQGQNQLPLLFFITSRPEEHISSAINSRKFTKSLVRLALNDTFSPDDDIRRFLQDSFDEVKETHRMKAYLPPMWPSRKAMETLIRKSSGHFIYASVVVKYVKSPRHRPTDRLEIILGLQPALNDTPFTELDTLYRHILSSMDNVEIVLLILSFVLLQADFGWSNDSRFIEGFFSLHPGDVLLHFHGLGSLNATPNAGYPFCMHPFGISYLIHRVPKSSLFILPRSIQYLRANVSNSIIVNHQLQIALEYHCTRALPTIDLRQDILEFSAFSIQKAMVERGVLLSQSIFAFISSIKSLDFEDGEQLYARQVASFEQFILAALPKYYSNPKLTVLVAMKVVMNVGHEQVQTLLQLDDVAQYIDDINLYLLHYNLDNAEENILFSSFLRNYIEDPAKAGEFVFDGHKFAISALWCLKYICRHDGAMSPSRCSQHDLRIRRRAPWRWHQKRSKGGALNGRRLRRWKGYQFMIHPDRTFINTEMIRYPRVVEGEIWQRRLQQNAYLPGLETIPALLDRSCNSHELAKFARQRTFSMLSFRYPRQTKLAKQAIERYLERVGANSEKVMDVDGVQ
ncbi:hypothetical protein BDZ97DRAFT_2056959 [Flammula alnicola]|nr:hypothetical protein BDZ97DRAFT_2056959 [Flammula alnicola]